MTKSKVNYKLTYIFAAVWISNGLFCKVLNFVPRHEQIVMQILNVDRPSANLITLAIGFSEIFMAIWILSGFKSRHNAIAQIVIVAIMNTLEYIMVPELLLWGKFNSLIAFVFILAVYYNEFYLNKKQLN